VVPARGLLQGSCYRRHAQLHRAWRRQGGLLQARLKLQAARSVCGAHSRSPTVRRRSNSQHTALLGTQLARTRGDPATGGGLRINQFTFEARL
jgi:hypothetical protein